MNRIYQGRVSRAELLDAKGETISQPDWDWEGALWDHHALFQDAVNYYLVCLLALASDPTSDQWKIRQRMTTEGSEHFVWGTFRRRSVMRRGMRASVAPYLTPGIDEPSFEQCAEAAFAGNESDAATRDVALHALLDACDGASAVQQGGRSFWPKFCEPKFSGSFSGDPAMQRRAAHQKRLPQVLHAVETRWDSEVLDEFDTYSIATPDQKNPKLVGSKALARLRQALAAWRERQPESAENFDRLAQKIAALPETTELQGYVGSSAKGDVQLRLFALLLFRHIERSEFTLSLLRAVTPQPKELDASGAVESPSAPPAADPIRLARGARGYIFRAFTSLPCWNPANTAEPQWKEFDIAAFKYALTALHQVDAKGEERRKELTKLQARHDYQRGQTKKWKGDGQSDVVPPRLADDPRIARLEELLRSDLAAEEALSEGQMTEHGLHPRTIRGFRDVRKKWNASLDPGEDYSAAAREKLWTLLTEYKKENAATMGSPALFDAMVEQPNWIIWRDPDASLLARWRKAAKLPDEVDFATDPLQALTDERELIEEMKRLAEPIRLTPADPEHSRRQFYFSDVVNLTEGGRYRHEPNQCTVIVPLAVLEGVQWRETRLRLRYTAPRLQRDGLRRNDGENLGAVPWLQPMMAALGLPEPLPQDFRDCPVALMPDFATSGARRILLNFPITLNPEPLARRLGKAARWEDMQFGPNFKNSSYLRWPSTWDKKAKSPPWWESGEAFHCLAVDLGQRDAGAFAVLKAQAGDDFGVVKAGKRNGVRRLSRSLGEAGGRHWFAAVEAAGMLRLPGEDARVLRGGILQEELSGQRGRLASTVEWEEAGDICTQLGLDAERVLGSDPRRYSFPELNDRLNFALRRAQARLARLQSWSCLAHAEMKEERRQRIADQIKDAIEGIAAIEPKARTDFDRLVLDLQPLAEKAAWALSATKIIVELERLRALISQTLLRVADRIQPLRGRRWEWARRDDGSGCHVLRQTARGSDEREKLLAGQRGLSMKRIEQLEELRHRCQSLNRALLQTPGQPAKLGRSKRGIELPDPCPELLDRLEALKEQRVNQTAHLILAQALGVRLRTHAESDHEERQRLDVHGEYERIPGRDPVDFLVLENLDRYLATQGRSRGENSRLMKWCHRQVLGKLKQLGEPYGLRVLETPAAYSSRFCSVTGIAGFRAVELTPADRRDFRWSKHLDRLEAEACGEKKLSREERMESQHVKTLFDQLANFNADLLTARPVRPKWRTLLAPVAGGPIFVPMRGAPQQADINAAINLGLRAVAAPENHEIHLRLRSERKGECFHVRAGNLREKARWQDAAPPIEFESETDRQANLTEARPNFFADLGGVANFDQVKVTGLPCLAASGRGLWGTIKQRDWIRVNEINCSRLQKHQDTDDQIPM
jgi:hypothetical protein